MKHAKNKLVAAALAPLLFVGAAIAEDKTFSEDSLKETAIKDYDNVVIEDGVHVRTVSHSTNGAPVSNVGKLTIGGGATLEASYTGAASGKFELGELAGSGTMLFSFRGAVTTSDNLNTENFTGDLVFEDVQGLYGTTLNLKSAAGAFANSNIRLSEHSILAYQFKPESAYEISNKISGNGALQFGSYSYNPATEASKDRFVVNGDLSGFNGSWVVKSSASLRVESDFDDTFAVKSDNMSTIELVGAAGQEKRNITIDANKSTVGGGNIFMYGNGVTIKNNSGSIFMGGNNEYTADSVELDLNNNTVLNGSAGTVYGGGMGTGSLSGSNSVVSNGVNITVGDDISVSKLVGGGRDGAVVNGDVKIVVNGGTISQLAGAGESGVRNGDTYVEVNGGTVDRLIVGDYSGGQINGDLHFKMTGGTVNQLLGMNYVYNSTAAADVKPYTGNITYDISGGTVGDTFRAGINSSNPGSGADLTESKSKMVLNGNVTVNVSGDAVLQGELYLGSNYSTTNGNFLVNISDSARVEGTLGKHYGAKANGDFIVDMDGGYVRTISGSGFTGKTVATFSGDSVEIGSMVSGMKNVNFGTEEKAFNGTFSALISGSEQISIGANSNMIFDKSFTTDLLLVDSSASVSLADGTKFDELNILFDSECGTGDALELSLADIFGDTATIVESVINSKESNFVLTNSLGEEFSAFITGDGHIGVGAAVPEPAAIAAIFGAIALAFAAYRRRK